MAGTRRNVMNRRSTVKTGTRSRRGRGRGNNRRVAFVNPPLRRAIKNIVRGQAETKMVTYYNGPVGTPSSGLLADAAPVSQNQNISVNNTDILRLIPDVSQGPADNNRIGDTIRPVSLVGKFQVMISPISTGGAGWQNNNAYDLTVVAYCLKHVSYKTYTSLYTSNDFSKMLKVGDGTTKSFAGKYPDSTMEVHPGYYQVLHKKKIYLRSSGYFTGGSGVGISNNNSHPLQHEWTWNLTKHLPKTLQYPENNVTTIDVDRPLNAAPFWCVAYYNTDGTMSSQPTIWIQQQYTTILKFKDS